MTPPRDLGWLFKCRQCKHHYQVQADEVRCRLKYCRYEPSFEAKEFMKLQMAIIEADKE